MCGTRFLRVVGAISFILMGSSIVSCSPDCRLDPSSQLDKAMSSKVMSYDEFARVSALTETMSQPSGQTAADCDLGCQSRRLEFRYVVYVGKQIYCYWDLKKADTKIDFDALATTLENSITSSTTNTQYYLILRKWASSFHDGHVNVMLQDPAFIETYTAPVRVETLAPGTDHEKVIVSTADHSLGLDVGDEVLMINDVPAREAVATASTMTSGSTERMRHFFAVRTLVDAMGSENVSKPFTLTVKSLAKDTVKTVSMYRSVQINVDASPTPSSSTEASDTGLANIKAQILPNAIGYLRIDAFDGTQDESLFEKAMDRLESTRGLILDLRKNGGGDLSGDKIIARLANADVIRYKRSERLSDYILSQDSSFFELTPDSTGMFATWHDLTVSANKSHHYGKPVVALISPWCFSACDTFSASLKANHLATFVGEPTGGGTGTPLVFTLPKSPMQFRYSIIRGETPEGTWIEQNGTQPDIYIEPTASDRARVYDGQLAKAVEVIDKQLAGPQNPPAAPTAPSAVSLVEPIWKQNLDESPTLEQNRWLTRIRDRDER